MPAQKSPILTLPNIAVAAISECLAVSYGGNIATAAGAMQGLAINDAAIGESFGVDVLGTSVAIAGAAVAKDAELEVGAGGKLVTKAAGVVVARALQAASGNGSKFEVMLLPK